MSIITQSDKNIEDLLELIELLWEKIQYIASDSGIYSNYHREKDQKIREKIKEIHDNNTHVISAQELVLTLTRGDE